MKRKKTRFLIIGAGVSGLTTALALSHKFPGEVLVLEKEQTVGGLLRTLTRNSARYDLGSHRIHQSPSQRAFRLIQEVCGEELLKKERGGKLRLKKSYVNYPITSFQMFRGIGLLESALCGLSLVRYRLGSSLRGEGRIRENDNYESYLVRRAGKRAYQLFYEPYARKVWGGEPSLISTTAVKKRISMLSPTLFLKDMIAHYAGRSPSQYYYYLRGGISRLPESLARQVNESGGEVVVGVKDFWLDLHQGRRICRLKSDSATEVEFETLITTIPLDEFLLKIDLPEGVRRRVESVRWRGLRLVFLHVEGEPRLDGESFYFPELSYVFGRVSVPKRFDPSMQPDSGETAFTCEIPCSEDDGLWAAPDGPVFEMCWESLRQAELIGQNQKALVAKSFSLRLPKIYPVYQIGWDGLIKDLLFFAAQKFPFIYSSGKPGLFLHNNIDHSIEIGLVLADDILEGLSPSDWLLRLDSFHNMKLRD